MRCVPKSPYLHGLTLLVTVALMLAAGAASFAEPTPGQMFDDWAVHCEVPRGRTDERCFIFQNVVRTGGGERLVHLAVGYLTTDEQPAAMITLPPGIWLPPGVRIRIAGEEIASFPLQRCDGSGCFGVVELSAARLEALRTGDELRVHFYDGTHNEITAPVSLRGFAEGFDTLR